MQLQEPILAMPYSFMVPILNHSPEASRPLKKTDAAKGKKYLELARVLLARFPSDTSGRAVQFLIDLVRNQDPGDMFPLPWYTTAGSLGEIQIGRPKGLFRVAPAMVFQARIGR